MLLRRYHYQVRQPPASGAFAAATFLALAPGFRTGREFGRWNRQILTQLGRSEGLLAYSLQRTIRGRDFWTLSLWRDREAMGAFVGAMPHRTAAAWLRDGRIRESRFAHWECGPSMPSWEVAYERLGVPVPPGRVLQPPTSPPPAWSAP